MRRTASGRVSLAGGHARLTPGVARPWCPEALQPCWAFADSECCGTILEVESPGREARTSSSPSSSEEALGKRLLRSLSE